MKKGKTKLLKSQKSFILRQVGAYALIAGVVTAIAVPISIKISEGKREKKPLLKQELEYSMDEKLFMKKGKIFQKSYDKNKDGSWSLNKEFNKLYTRGKPFGYNEPEKVDAENKDRITQAYMYGSNGIRVWSTDILPLGSKLSASDMSTNEYFLNNVLQNDANSEINFNGESNSFMSDLQDELLKLDSMYIANRTSDFILVSSMADKANFQYSDITGIAVGRETYAASHILSLPVAAYEVISSFISDNFDYTSESQPTGNALIASKLAAIEGGILNNVSSDYKTVVAFFNRLKSVKDIFELPVTLNGNKTVKFREYLKKGIIQNLKWYVNLSLAKQAIFMGTPRERTQSNTLAGEGSEFIKNAIKQYSEMGDEKQGTWSSGLTNGQKFAFEKGDEEPIRKMLSIPQNNEAGIVGFDPTNVETIKNAPFSYIGENYVWNGQKFETNGTYAKTNSFSDGDYDTSRSFGWRTLGQRFFVSETLDGIKVSSEVKSGYKSNKVNPFVLKTDDKSYNDFKSIIGRIKNDEISKDESSFFFDIPNEGKPSVFDYKIDDITFHDTNKTIDNLRFQIPLKFYSETISNFIKNPSLTKDENKALVKQVIFSTYSTLRFNPNNKEIKIDDINTVSNTFSLINDNNIDIILDKVYNKLFDSNTTTFKTEFTGAANKHDVASASRLLFENVMNPSNVDQDGYSSAYQQFLYKNGGYGQQLINKDGDAQNPGDIPRDTSLMKTPFSSIVNTTAVNMALLLAIGTFKVDADDAPFATEYNVWISKLVAQGYDIFNADKSGFSDTMINGLKALVKNIDKIGEEISWGGQTINNKTSQPGGNNLVIRSDKNIDHLMINGNKVNVFKYGINPTIQKNPSTSIEFDELKGKTTYISEPFSVGGYTFSVANPIDSENKDFKVLVYSDKEEKHKVAINSVSDRTPYNTQEENPLAISDSFLDIDKDGDVILKTFINTKGL